jgi:hypothetical protein
MNIAFTEGRAYCKNRAAENRWVGLLIRVRNEDQAKEKYDAMLLNFMQRLISTRFF